MSEWKSIRLGKVTKLNYGKALKEQDQTEGDVPVYSSAGLTGYHNEPLVTSEGLIVGRKGTIGKVYYSPMPFFCIDTAYFILPNEDVYNFKFLYYLLQTLRLDELNEDSAVPGLNRETCYSQEISLPSLPEQKTIADYLGRKTEQIDTLTEKKQKQIELLKEQRTAIINQAVTKGLNPDVNWKTIQISDGAEVIGGGTPSTEDPRNFGGDISWLTPKDLSKYNFRYISHGKRNITRQGLRSSSARLLPKGTVLLSTRAPIGYVAIAENPMATNQGFQSLVPKENIVSEYLYYLLKINTEYLRANASGSTFGELSGSTLKRLVFKFPEKNEQKTIADYLDRKTEQIDTLTEKKQKQIELLSEYRTALITNAVTGTIDIRNEVAGVKNAHS